MPLLCQSAVPRLSGIEYLVLSHDSRPLQPDRAMSPIENGASVTLATDGSCTDSAQTFETHPTTSSQSTASHRVRVTA